MMSLEPFWELMEKMNITRYALENEYNLNPAEINRLKYGHNFTMKTLERYCKIFRCRVEDIICYVPDDVEEEN